MIKRRFQMPSLIEILIGSAILCGLAMVVLGGVLGRYQSGSVTYGVTGLTEVRCIEGRKFVLATGRGNSHSTINQMLDADGKPELCQ